MTTLNFSNDATPAQQIVAYCSAHDALLTLYRMLQQHYPATLLDLKADDRTPLPPSTQPTRRSTTLLGCLLPLLVIGARGFYLYSKVGPVRFNQPVDRFDSPAAVSMASAQDGWLVGGTYRQDEPTAVLLLHWNGEEWSRLDERINGNLNAVQMVAADEGWAVGDDHTSDGNQGLILHYQTGKWRKQLAPATNGLYGLWMVGPDEGWAVGWNTILHYQQGTWKVDKVVADSSPLGILRAVQMDSRKHGWAVGDGGAIFEYNGTEWHKVATPTTKGLDALAFSGPTEGWAVGSSGTVLHYKAGQWRVVEVPYTAKDLTTVCLLSSSEVWVLGKDGITLHYSGGQWTKGSLNNSGPRTKNGPSISSIDVRGATIISASDGWATARYGNLLRFEGGAWKPFYRN